jgi:hypothetical protein
MSQSQANESADSKEQATSSTLLQLNQTPVSNSNYYVVVPEDEYDRPLNPFSQH